LEGRKKEGFEANRREKNYPSYATHKPRHSIKLFGRRGTGKNGMLEGKKIERQQRGKKLGEQSFNSELLWWL